MTQVLDLVDGSDSVLAITHTHADFDSVGSAVALAATLDARVDIVLPDDSKGNAEELLADDHRVVDPDCGKYDCLVVVDAPSTERIAPVDVETVSTPLAVIDHHEPADLADIATATYIDTDASATALLVADLLDEAGYDLSRRAGFALTAGVWGDTGGQAVLDPVWKAQMQSLLDAAGTETTRIPELVHPTAEWPERVATARAVHRAEGYKAGQVLLLVSQVGAHQTAVARALLGANADVALVLSERSERIWVTARTAMNADNELSLPADLFRPLADEFGGYGGGHEGAGIAKVDADSVDSVRIRAIELIENTLEVQFGRLS